MADKDLLMSWLNDAYALENGLIPILENHAKDAAKDPAAKSRIELHAEQTRRHAELVKGCVEKLGGSTSAVKTGMAGLMGAIQSVSTGMFADELVKNALADYAAEHFEIACYTALITAARSAGEEHVAQTCGEILKDEQDMADWLKQQLPKIVREALTRAGELRTARR